MRTLFIEDIHTKINIIKRIEELIKEDKTIENVVFLGDYLDDWSATFIDNLNTLHHIIDFKNLYKDKVHLLLGNHELSYLGFPCSGYNKSEEVSNLLYKNINLFDISYESEYFICSHAGFNNIWLNMLKEKYLFKDNEEAIHKVNEMFNNKDGSILKDLSISSTTSGSYSLCASCLWARPADHRYYSINIGKDQIVGHTPLVGSIKDNVSQVIYDGLETNYRIFYIDTFSTYKNTSEPIGKEEVLIFDNDNKSYFSKSLVSDKEEFICCI